MKSYYVVIRHIPSVTDKCNIDSCVQALTENLHLAEKVIADYYTSSFGPGGEFLVCTTEPNCCDVRTYFTRSHFNEVIGATYFTVYEEEIKNDSALI